MRAVLRLLSDLATTELNRLGFGLGESTDRVEWVRRSTSGSRFDGLDLSMDGGARLATLIAPFTLAL